MHDQLQGKSIRSIAAVLAFTGGVSLLSSCAAKRPNGPAEVRPDWNGRFSKPVGLYLVAARGPFTIAQFEAVSLAGQTLERLEPGLKWVTIDSGNHRVKRLGGWDLDSLTDLLVADSAVWMGARSADSLSLQMREPRLSEATKAALRRVGEAMDVQILVALRPGGARNQRDSLDSFEDPAWFGVYDLTTAQQLYSLAVPVKGSKSASRSAETDWARETWSAFEKGIGEVRRRSR
ncbi:MAG TPA: hypothetical protein PKO15_09450 [Fibrobacteria bacterium]|nr:hypothetical protein [Fibrobacteria bacterium]